MTMCLLCMTKPPRSRGLCNTCYRREERAGHLHKWSPMRNPGACRHTPPEIVRPRRPCIRCTLPTTSEVRLCPDCISVTTDLGEYEEWAS